MVGTCDYLSSDIAHKVEDAVYRDLCAFETGFKCVRDLHSILTRIDSNLVCNLSAHCMSNAEFALLRIGTQFSVTGAQSRLRGYNQAHKCINNFLYAFSERLQRVENEQRDHPARYSLAVPDNSNLSCRRKFKRKVRSIVPRSIADLSFENALLMNYARMRLTSALRESHVYNVTNLPPSELQALRTIKMEIRNAKIVVRKADKGRQIVVMNKHDYVAAVRALLYDDNNYLKIPFNRKRLAAALIIRILKQEAQFLPDCVKRDLLLFTNEPKSRYFYALPKVHKNRTKWAFNVPPMRPICPDIKTESTMSARYIASYLQPFVKLLPSFTPNSYDVTRDLSIFHDLPCHTVLLVADIDSLYPNIPVDDAFETIKGLFSQQRAEYIPIEVRTLILRLLYCQLHHNYFEFEGECFQQIRGVPMGKAWAPAVAYLFLENWDAELIKRLKFPPFYFKRYVDDILLVCPSQLYADQALSIMNDMNNNIKIGDHVSGQSVSFLDIQITVRRSYDQPCTLSESVCATSHRCSLSISLYRKPTDLITILHFRSAHSMCIKVNTLFSQCLRIWRLTNDYSTAGMNVRVLFECMMRFRELPLRTCRNLHLKLLYWAAKQRISVYARYYVNDARSVRSVFKRYPTVLRLPSCVNPIMMQRALKCVYDSLSLPQQRSVSRFLIGVHTEPCLQQLLF